MGRQCRLQEEFAKAELGDARRVRRLALLASRLGAKPQSSIPAACRGWAETMAAYRLLNSADVGNEEILEAHRGAMLQRASACTELLMLQDTTELDYSGHRALQGAGPLADGRHGFFAHSRLVVAEEEAALLGVEGCKMWARGEHGTGKIQPAKKRSLKQKESRRWIEGYLKGCALLDELPAGTRLTVVGDRESDIYELFVAHAQKGSSGADFMVRACQDRALMDGRKLFESCREAPLLGSYEFEVRAAKITRKFKGSTRRLSRQSRTSTMMVRATKVTLRPPWRRGPHKLPPIELWVLCAREQQPPEGELPIEWIMLTSQEIKDLQTARRLLRNYSLRWLCEEFHYVLKSGCGVQDLALRDGSAIQAAVALYMVIAWRILYLRDFSRARPELSSEDFFDPVERHIATLLLGMQQSERAPPLGQMVRLVGQLGGHLGRRSDGPPGSQVLWQGLTRLGDAVFIQQNIAEANGS